MRSGKAPEILVGRPEDRGEHEHENDEHPAEPSDQSRMTSAIDSRSDQLSIFARPESALADSGLAQCGRRDSNPQALSSTGT
jgi:hypothetical protein